VKISQGFIHKSGSHRRMRSRNEIACTETLLARPHGYRAARLPLFWIQLSWGQ
jgi:hypothetical protein